MYELELAFARRVAREAEEVVLRIYEAAGRDQGSLQVEHKGGGLGPVTEADQAVNDLLVSRIQAEFPDDAILAEESEDDGRRLEAARFWCIDPLDGTKEFIKRNGEFSIMIGLVDRAAGGRPVLGVVVEPAHRVIMVAAEGHGAFIEGPDGVPRRLQVSDRAEGHRLRFIVSRSHPDPETTEVARRLDIEQMRPCGSVGLKLGRIAEDEADAYLNFSGKTWFWDTCAPEAIFAQAGGRLTRLDGQPIDYLAASPRNDYPLLASNGASHDLLLETCRAVLADLNEG